MLVVEQEALPVLFCATPQTLETLVPLLVLARLLSSGWSLLPGNPTGAWILQGEEPL